MFRRAFDLRSAIFAWWNRPLAAETETPISPAISFIEWPCSACSSRGRRMLGRRFVIALRTSLARSFSTYCFSGSGAESVISQSASLSLLLCAGTSRELRLFRKIISAELIPMRVNQVEKVDRPSKLWRWRNALRNASWTASSASSWLRVMRRTVQRGFCACAWHHGSSPPVFLLLAVAASFMPLIRFLASIGAPHVDLPKYRAPSYAFGPVPQADFVPATSIR